MKNPIQPIVTDAKGVLRFKANAIVQYLLDLSTERGCSLNELALMDFTADDRQQLMQLIGYSLGGYGDLSYVSDDTFEVASTMGAEGLTEAQARMAYLEAELVALRRELREPMARLFGVH